MAVVALLGAGRVGSGKQLFGEVTAGCRGIARDNHRQQHRGVTGDCCWVAIEYRSVEGCGIALDDCSQLGNKEDIHWTTLLLLVQDRP